MEVQLVQFGSPDYDRMVQLRVAALLNPIGISASYIVPVDEKDDLFIAAQENDLIVGCCILTKKDTSIVQLRQMAVHPDYQGQGIGAAILGFAEQIARDHHYKRMIMHARNPVINFYKKCGYHTTGEPFLEVGMVHHQMEKEL